MSNMAGALQLKSSDTTSQEFCHFWVVPALTGHTEPYPVPGSGQRWVLKESRGNMALWRHVPVDIPWCAAGTGIYFLSWRVLWLRSL